MIGHTMLLLQRKPVRINSNFTFHYSRVDLREKKIVSLLAFHCTDN